MKHTFSLSSRYRICISIFRVFFYIFSPLHPRTGRFHMNFYDANFFTSLQIPISVIYAIKCVCNWCLSDIDFFRYFSCILLYFCFFEPPNRKVPDQFSWRQFFYNLTVTFLSNFRHKVCLELISFRDRILFLYLSWFLPILAPLHTRTGRFQIDFPVANFLQAYSDLFK